MQVFFELFFKNSYFVAEKILNNNKDLYIKEKKMQKTQIKIKESVAVGDTSKQLGRVFTFSMVSIAGSIGIWSMACMISGIYHAGGIINLASSWLSAVV